MGIGYQGNAEVIVFQQVLVKPVRATRSVIVSTHVLEVSSFISLSSFVQ